MSNIVKLKKKAADFEQKKQFEKALQLYIQALEEAGRDLDDADVPLYNRVGDLLMRQGDVSDALAYYEKAVDVYAERGFLNNAIALCNKILRQSPARTAVYYKLGKISATKGFKSDAKKNFLEYADRMQKAGQRDEAFRALKEFADLCPDQDDVRLMLAELLTKENRKNEAIEQLQVLHEKLAAEGRGAEARATLDRMKAIDPEASPRITGMHHAIKPNELVFLDVSDAVSPGGALRHEAPAAPADADEESAAAEEEPTTPAASIPALEGLALTFVPDADEAPAEAADSAEAIPDLVPTVEELPSDVPLLSGFSADGVTHTGVHGLIEDVDVGSMLEGPPARPEDLTDDPAAVLHDANALHQDWGVPLFDSATENPAGELPPQLAPLADVPPLSGSEFAEMALLETVPVRHTPAHDLTLPSDLPLLPVDEAEVPVAPGDPAFDLDSSTAVLAEEPASVVDDGTAEFTIPSDPAVAGGTHAAADDTDARADGTDRIDEAFEKAVVELPLLDLDSGDAAPADVVLTNLAPMFLEGSAESLLTTPGFGEEGEGGEFEPAPRLSHDTLQPDGWPADATPEVLIDGEWHDEHVGNMVAQGLDGASPRRFDDLAAAMMWPPPEGAEGASAEDAPAAIHTPRSLLSFGGVEEQLARRVELEPENWALRRQFGEALLDGGRRDEGLAELDLAMAGFESAGNLDDAQSLADGIIRLLPSSVRHHQKRVEYAVRANDRARLVDAYLELGDALFRTGDPDKSMAVYSRVLELSPGNERAAFALSALMPTTAEALDAAFEDRAIALPDTAHFISDVVVEAAADVAPDDGEGHAYGEPAAAVMPSAPAARSASAPDESLPSRDAAPSGAGSDVEEAELDQAFVDVNATFQRLSGAHEAVSDSPAHTPPVDAFAETALPGVAALRPQPAPPAPPEPEPFVDLGGWLRSTEPERSTRMVVEDATPTGDEQADFQEMLRRFKRGVAANVDEEDYESHYDLGVAYKEMGLVDEAIAQFQRSLRGADQRVKSYEALGQCFVEKGQFAVAAALLQRAVETAASEDHELVGVLFLLGFAMEATGRQTEAVRYYQRVFAVDIEFRDVAQRIATLAPASA